MDDLRLRELLRPLAQAIEPPAALRAQRNVREGFRDDGSLEPRVVSSVLPLQRLDWVVAPSTAAGVMTERYYIPEDAMGTRLVMISTSNAGATFSVDVLVNGVVKASSAIRIGATQANGGVSMPLPAGSVVSLQTNASIPQGVTVSLYCRSAGSSGSGGSSAGGGLGPVVMPDLSDYALKSSLSAVALSGAYPDLSDKPTVPTTLAALDTTVTGAQLDALKAKVDGIAAGATANATDAQLRARSTHTGTQAASTISDFSSAADARVNAQKGTANGLATLGADGKIPSAQLPLFTLTDVNVVASQAAQLALTAQEGDIAIRTDLSRTYIHNGGTAGTMADWSEMLAPTGGAGAVSSVNGKTGAVTLLTTDVAEGTNLYYTDARVTANATVAANTAARHSHANKVTLDAITAAYTSAEATKLAGIAAGADVNVQSDWNATTGDAAILNKPDIPATANAKLATSWTTTLATASNVTGLSFPIGANESWTAEFHLQTGCNNTGGIKYAITIPSGNMRAVHLGMGATATTMVSNVFAASGTLTGTASNTVNLATGWTRITLSINNGATAGTVQLQAASGVATQTSTIFAHSYVTARRI